MYLMFNLLAAFSVVSSIFSLRPLYYITAKRYHNKLTTLLHPYILGALSQCFDCSLWQLINVGIARSKPMFLGISQVLCMNNVALNTITCFIDTCFCSQDDYCFPFSSLVLQMKQFSLMIGNLRHAVTFIVCCNLPSYYCQCLLMVQLIHLSIFFSQFYQWLVFP